MKHLINHLKEEWYKYLLEIMVITAGILGAFMLNNWNEGRKQSIQELKILKELHTDLIQNLEEIEVDLESQKYHMYQTVTFRDYLLGIRPIDDSLSGYFLATTSDNQFWPKTSAYQNLKSKGLDLLSNDSLRMEVTILYELLYPRLVELGHLQENKFDIRSLMSPFINKHCKISETQSRAITEKSITEGRPSIPIYLPEVKDIEALFADEDLALAIGRSINIRWRKIRRHVDFSEKTQWTIQHIEKEIEELGGSISANQ